MPINANADAVRIIRDTEVLKYRAADAGTVIKQKPAMLVLIPKVEDVEEFNVIGHRCEQCQ